MMITVDRHLAAGIVPEPWGATTLMRQGNRHWGRGGKPRASKEAKTRRRGRLGIVIGRLYSVARSVQLRGGGRGGSHSGFHQPSDAPRQSQGVRGGVDGVTTKRVQEFDGVGRLQQANDMPSLGSDDTSDRLYLLLHWRRHAHHNQSDGTQLTVVVRCSFATIGIRMFWRWCWCWCWSAAFVSPRRPGVSQDKSQDTTSRASCQCQDT